MERPPLAFLTDVLECIRDSEGSGLLFEDKSKALNGLSGLKTVGALQRFCRLFHGDQTACYLEIGVYQGLTLLSVAGNFMDFPCVGIDNFSILDPEQKNLDMVVSRIEKLEAKNVILINQDFEEAFKSLKDHLLGRKIAIYFIDGAHDYRSQLIALLHAQKHLHEHAVVVVDDANYEFVRQANKDFLLAFPDYKLVFEAYSPAHPANLSAQELAKHERGWLNGVNILVRDPAGYLPIMYPPVSPNHSLYVNDWLVHRHQFARLAPEALSLAQSVCNGNADGKKEAEVNLISGYEDLKTELNSLQGDRNTFSVGLTEGNLNKIVVNP